MATQKQETKQETKPKKVKAVVTGKVKLDGKLVEVGKQIDVELVDGELPPSLLFKVSLAK